MRSKLTFIVSLCLCFPAVAEIDLQIPKPVLEEVLVTGGRESIRTLSGSAQLLDEEILQQFDYSDLNQVMSFLPGVYVRQEEGYGLRPNIGIRGAAAERSQKITLMEDGVLIAPAPYSAPAAYYLPNVSRMSAVELVKGPSAIQHGPHTVGGAINMATRAITDDQAELDVTFGSDQFHKLRALYGSDNDQFGYWVEGLRYGADGFKQLDGGGDTGFERNDINAKLQWRSASGVARPQQLTLKLGYADEDSDETYLGLTDDDFQRNPNRRYAASQLDHFNSEHTQVHADHIISLSETLRLNTKIYWNEFDRAWNKFDGFIAGSSLGPDLDLSDSLLAILRGEANSDGSDNQMIDVTNNDRSYGSYGVQTQGSISLGDNNSRHEITAGLRIHHDYVDRNHRVQGYLMQDGTLIADGQDRTAKVLNHAETDAIAVFVQDKIERNNWQYTLGLRYEDIEGELRNDLNPALSDTNRQSIVMPGLGVYWQYNDYLGFLAGVNKGFSPAGPGAADNVEPEESINYEFGLRYQTARLYLEWIGFFFFFTNLLGRCRVSDTGCEVGEEFNGGEVEIGGSEITGHYYWQLNDQLTMPISFSYTYTESAFQTRFQSRFSQWGNVSKGDALTYLPENIARLQLGLESIAWRLQLAWKHQDEMREEAGRGEITDGLHSDKLTTVDVAAAWDFKPGMMLQLSVDNAADEKAIVSHRPFGARPNKPQSVNLRLKYEF